MTQNTALPLNPETVQAALMALAESNLPEHMARLDGKGQAHDWMRVLEPHLNNIKVIAEACAAGMLKVCTPAGTKETT